MIQITLPWPPPILSPNKKAHWGTKGRARAKQRADCGYLTIAQMTPIQRMRYRHFDKIGVHLDFHPSDRRRRDMDNLIAASKGLLDGLADGIDCDDVKFVLSQTLHPYSKAVTGVVVTLKELI